MFLGAERYWLDVRKASENKYLQISVYLIYRISPLHFT